MATERDTSERTDQQESTDAPIFDGQRVSKGRRRSRESGTDSSDQ